jgi:hypothetical protein
MKGMMIRNSNMIHKRDKKNPIESIRKIRVNTKAWLVIKQRNPVLTTMKVEISMLSITMRMICE